MRRTPFAIMIALAACCLIALIVLIIAVGGGPVPTLIGLVLAVLPVPLLLSAVLSLDRLEPEPPSLLTLMFAAGAGAAALIALAGYLLGTRLVAPPELGPEAGRLVSTPLAAAIGGAVVAESLKGGALLGLLRFRRAEIDGVQDGVVYATLTGLGFALISNLYAYLHAEHIGLSALASAFIWRGILGPLWDPVFTSVIGVGVGYAAIHRGRRRALWAIGAGWVGAVALHTLWNNSVKAAPGRIATVYLLLIVVLGLLLVAMVADRHRIVRMIAGCFPVFAEADVATASDVEMLVSLPARRQARQWARLHAGGPAGQSMTGYQLTATELALATDRCGNGLMPGDEFADFRSDSLARMRAAVSVFRDRRPPLQQRPPWAQRTLSAFVAGESSPAGTHAASERPADPPTAPEPPG